MEAERDQVASSMAVELRRATRPSENGSVSSGGSHRAAIREALDNLSELAAYFLGQMKVLWPLASGGQASKKRRRTEALKLMGDLAVKVESLFDSPEAETTYRPFCFPASMPEGARDPALLTAEDLLLPLASELEAIQLVINRPGIPQPTVAIPEEERQTAYDYDWGRKMLPPVDDRLVYQLATAAVTGGQNLLNSRVGPVDACC